MKKKINIVLLIVVTGLWGTILYKYISPYFQNDDSLLENNKHFNYLSSKIINKDTFELKPLSRDPFLGKSYSQKITNIKTTQKRTFINKPVIKTVNPKPILSFPAVQYYGYIKNETGGSELVLIKMNGKLLRLKNNETKEGLKLVKIYKDSIKVSFGGESKVFRK